MLPKTKLPLSCTSINESSKYRKHTINTKLFYFNHFDSELSERGIDFGKLSRGDPMCEVLACPHRELARDTAKLPRDMLI